MTPAAVICSAIGGSNREERTSQVLDALTRSGWAFANMKDIGGTSLGILKDAIAFIEGLAVVPLLMNDDIEMRLEDVQEHARIEAASLRKRLTDRSTRPAETAGCMCRDVAFGSHKVAVPMKLPAHMQAEERARVEAGLSPCITVDACLVEEVSDLWAKGIRTTGCCCGHNKAVGYIGVNKGDIPAMKGLGYVVRENTSRPGAQDGFIPKSIKYGDRPAEPAAPVAEVREVVAWGVETDGFWELCNDEETARYRHEPARKVEPLVRLSTLEAERARADAAEARIIELEAVEKTLRWSVKDSEANLAAAEQRAADALARAEKARALAERGAHLARTVSQTKFRLESGDRYSVAMFDANNMVALARTIDRASREAQPATDGGEA